MPVDVSPSQELETLIARLDVIAPPPARDIPQPARWTTDDVAPAMARQSLHSLLREAAYDVYPYFEKRQLRLLGHYPPITVLADRPVLLHALRAILETAADASPPGGAVVLDAHGDGDRAVIDVTDDGGGFSADELRHIRSQRMDDARAVPGLANLRVARAVACLHGGDLKVYSAPGAGAIVRISGLIAAQR
ncbi:MAG: ATP-binding protein [Pseudomonadota bacterium]